MNQSSIRLAGLFALLVGAGSLAGIGGRQANDPLLFPKDDFTVETKTVKTSEGEKKVSYRSYVHIPYVANPVDKDYQSLNVSVPIAVDDKAVDASNAPILFTIGVGGYMSSRNADVGPGGAPRGGPARSGGSRRVSGNADLALAAGYVVVSPGCRGRDNRAADGTYYGKAPAAIVDLKAAVRYVRHNRGIISGNVDRIVSTGVSAGGALSALLGASGDSPLYDSYLKEIGAADADDTVYGSACFCPITDLDHADGAYEWMYGATPTRAGLVDQELSKRLRASFAEYQASLRLQGKNGFGTITADNYDKYLLRYYLVPSANKYLRGLTDEKRREYLADNKWIAWTEKGAAFSFADYVAHVGRMKGLPAFDDFAMKQPEPNVFGDKTTDSRHFTDFSLRHATGDMSAEITSDLKTLVSMMNAMSFIGRNNRGVAQHWWLRQGTSDNHTSQTVMANLATSLENRKHDVNIWLYWDAGHGADEDPEEFIAWISRVTGFSQGTPEGQARTVADPEIRAGVEAAVFMNLLPAATERDYPGYFNISADGAAFGGATWPGLDSWQMAGAYLLLGRTRLVLDYFDFVRASQRKDGNIPFAIFPGDTRPGGCLRGLKTPDDIFTYTPPRREGLPASSLETRRWIGLFEHWQTKGYPLAALGPVCYILTAAEIFDATGSEPWLKERLQSVEAAARYLLTLRQPDGLVGGSGFYIESPPREGCDGVTQCYAVHAFREMARLCRAAGEPSSAAEWAGRADRLSKAFLEAFWRQDHFGEYVHPKRGLIDSHGLSDVNWAAVAFGLAAGRKLERVWTRLMKEPGFWLGGMPTQNVTKPSSYEAWESSAQPECGIDPFNDVAAMGRVWYLEAAACQRMRARDRLIESVRRICQAGAADGYWRERYHPKPDGSVSADGAKKYCEYPAVLVRVVYGNRNAFWK